MNTVSVLDRSYPFRILLLDLLLTLAQLRRWRRAQFQLLKRARKHERRTIWPDRARRVLADIERLLKRIRARHGLLQPSFARTLTVDCQCHRRAFTEPATV